MSHSDLCKTLEYKEATQFRSIRSLSWEFTRALLYSISPKDQFVFQTFMSIDLGGSFTEAPKCTVDRFDSPYSPRYDGQASTHFPLPQPYSSDLPLASQDRTSLL
ncbi:hypothetical protein AVEN_124606-1 [Araneus ventricosus]|uniref:Uncharacterized protein n=1 Tax=Araneus ventricosus TaxID=182803 RepID=A0A4Y2KVA2_ARAVE|nr:hypothetical protein AVEN_124606-1 [Araneus ventricosus]